MDASNLDHERSKVMETAMQEIQQRIANALTGISGEDQQILATAGLKWVDLMLRKNRDYGSSAWKIPLLAPELSAGSAIQVRMSDKIERLRSLLNKNPEITDETIRDTVNDLGAYCLLWLARPAE